MSSESCNPFAGILFTGTDMTITNDTVRNRGSLVFYDCETIPDESRFERVVESRPCMDVDLPAIVEKQTASQITATVKQLPRDQLSDLLEIEGGREKPRKTVLNVIGNEIKLIDGSLDVWVKAHSVNPFTARIVAIGWAVDDEPVSSGIARNDDEERALLTNLWEILNSVPKRCGYNILSFDDMLIAIRSWMLGVDIARPLNRSRYGNKSAIDLMHVLFPSGNAMNCKDVANALGVEIPNPGVSGGDVFKFYHEGNWTAISDYVCSDVVVEREIYEITQRMLVV